MVEPKAFQDALLAYHARPCDAEAEAVRAAVLTDLRELLLRAAALLSERAPCADRECRVADDGAVMRCIDDLSAAARGVTASSAPKLAVWFGAMPESNGKTNWTAILHRGDMVEGFTIARSEHHDRVRYDADKVRWLLGETGFEPDILMYDGDMLSPPGYMHPCGVKEAGDAQR